MRIVMFYQSLISDWNHGNAHFLRGVVGELQRRGHRVEVYEPRDASSVTHLVAEQGAAALDRFAHAYPHLRSVVYERRTIDLFRVLRGADLVIVHESSHAQLVAAIGAIRARTPRLRLLFHDTHHASVSQPARLASLDLTQYDGVLAHGRVIRDRYLSEGWARRAWTWHAAADIGHFGPVTYERRLGDVVWIGNWADDERADALREFFVEPVRRLGIRATVYGVGYPEHARREMAGAGVQYGGWLPNADVPKTFARFAATVHVPRRPYVEALPGIPTIRPFEALACAIPLVSAPWHDIDGLFSAGRDFLVAENGAAMERQLAWVLAHPAEARTMAARGRRTIEARHTCGHRVDELLSIYSTLMRSRVRKAVRHARSAP
jgi:spore maturation protein CgeB